MAELDEDELDLVDDDDDDLGDDPDDGIDFEDLAAEEHTALEGSLPDVEELDVAAVGVEQSDESEGESDDARPEPPAEAGLDEGPEEEQ